MFNFKLFLTGSVIIVYFCNLVRCDLYKTNNGPARILLPSEESRKNQFHDVYISGENIPNITKDLFWEFRFVEELKVESSNVTFIEKQLFSNFDRMKKLSLKGNLLENIEYEDIAGGQLEELDLSDNQIRTIERIAFLSLHRLKRINLKNNKIEVIDNFMFPVYSSLSEINLEDNAIKVLPRRMLGFAEHQILDLYLSNNKIEEINEDAFLWIRSFNNLYLDHNRITTIPNKTFSSLEKIVNLKLDHNEICVLPDLTKVETYDVSGNPSKEKCLERASKLSTVGIVKPVGMSNYPRYIRIG